MRKKIFEIGLIILVVFICSDGVGQTSQSQPPGATRSSVKEFWTRYADVKIDSNLGGVMVDILVSSLLHAEVVDKVVALKFPGGAAVKAEELKTLEKETDSALEEIIDASPNGLAKVEAYSALFFWRDAKRVIEAKGVVDRETGLLEGLHRAQIVDMIGAFKSRVGSPLTKEANKALIEGPLSSILISIDGAEREYLTWSRSKYGN